MPAAVIGDTALAVSVRDLWISAPTANGWVDLVRGVDLSVPYGGTLALVGESGAGKSITARSLLGMTPPPTVMTHGTVQVGDLDVTTADDRALHMLRGGTIGLVPQDPTSALNPVRTIGSLFDEVVRRHQRHGRAARRRLIGAALDDVGLRHDVLARYPHQLSGGMRQRALIGMALVNDPSVIVADEPTTALDATVQAQILELLASHVAGRVALVLITHDLGVAATLCDEVNVMYAGRVVEQGATADVCNRPRHPYTAGLLAAAPDPATGGVGMVPIPGAPPAPADVAPGCAFKTRCPRRTEQCDRMPELDDGAQRVACWHPLDEPTGGGLTQ